MKKLLAIAAFLTFAVEPAMAHVGHGSTASLAAGFVHPFSGFDHVLVMLMVGLWAAQKGGRALWAWPAVFVGATLFGGVLAMHGTPLPFVEPAILASVVALGLWWHWPSIFRSAPGLPSLPYLHFFTAMRMAAR
jgi:urease accessory protein